jgi:hypothetical protein
MLKVTCPLPYVSVPLLSCQVYVSSVIKEIEVQMSYQEFLTGCPECGCNGNCDCEQWELEDHDIHGELNEEHWMKPLLDKLDNENKSFEDKLRKVRDYIDRTFDIGSDEYIELDKILRESNI